MSNPTHDEDGIAVLRRLMSYVKERRLGFVGGVIGMLGFAAVDAVFVSSIKPLIDEGLSGKNSAILTWMPLFVILIVTLRGFCTFLSSYCMAWVGNHVVMKLQQEVFNHLMALPMSFFDRENTAHLLSKITYDANQVSNSASSALVSLIREGATVIFLIGLMFYQSWQLSMVFLIIGPAVGVLISVINKRFRAVSRQSQRSMATMTATTDQMLKGHKEVLMFNGQQVEELRFADVSNKMRRQNMKMVSADAIGTPIVQIVASFALAIVLFVATIDDVRSTMTAGTFTLVITSMMMLMRPLREVTQVNTRFQRGITACQSLFGVLDTPTEQDNGELVIERVRGEVEFRNVTFTYAGKTTPALNNVSFTIPAGKSVALVGRSGSGKSTIASLLTRFYEIDQGEILLDGVNIREYTLSNLRSQFALVSQQVHLFNDTVANNIAYAAAERFTRDQIEQAGKIAHADDFVSKMEQGYDTMLGENGTNLSGGQRQRVAIARALLRDAPVLLLDEATSALDTESERHIQSAIDELCKQRTSLVIAHRLSTIEKADEILVIDEGRIVERGNHNQLMAKQGAYAQLRAIQFGEHS